MRSIAALAAILLPAAMLVGCDDDVDTTGPEFNAVAGTYQANEVTITDQLGNTRDLVAEGGTFNMTLSNTGTFSFTGDFDGAGPEAPFTRTGSYQLTESDLVLNDNPWVDVDPLEPLSFKYQRDELGLAVDGPGSYDFNEDGVIDPVDFYVDWSPI